MDSRDMESSATEDEDDMLEGLLAILQPDAVASEKPIVERIRQEGFLIVERRRMRLKPEKVRRLYAPHRDRPYFDRLVAYMSGGDVIAMCLARLDGIEHWRRVLGPTNVAEAKTAAPESLRAKYGQAAATRAQGAGRGAEHVFNGLHGSASPSESEREIEIIFPHILHSSEDEADISDVVSAGVDDVEDSSKGYLQKHVAPTLLRGLTEMYRTRPASPLTWLADWLDEHNPRHVDDAAVE
jgi:nucleoside-diphosphate kinase